MVREPLYNSLWLVIARGCDGAFVFFFRNFFHKDVEHCRHAVLYILAIVLRLSLFFAHWLMTMLLALWHEQTSSLGHEQPIALLFLPKPAIVRQKTSCDLSSCVPW